MSLAVQRARFGLAIVVALFALVAQAAVTVPNVISENMVVQRDKRIPIWGKASPGEQVQVSLDRRNASTTAGEDGTWRVNLKPLKAGGPYTLTIKGEQNTLTFSNVLVGEVWVCSGQSNMQWALSQSNNAEQEIAAANYPNIRLFKVPMKTSDTPWDNCDGSWAACTPEVAKDFTAVGYFFGRQLHQDLDVPIGLIQTAWGGTPAEAWTSRPCLESEPSLKPLLDRWEQTLAAYPQAMAQHQAALLEWEKQAEAAKAAGKEAPRKPGGPQGPESPHRPANLFNAMISPLVPYAIRGAIWYQGESNASRAYQYRTLFPLMINCWRDAWGTKDLSFYFVQLANFTERKPEPGDSDWAELREAQTMTLDLPKTGMAVIIDIGEANDIHPRNKQDVGKRLALWAKAKDYRQKIEYSGPLYRTSRVKGDAIVISFDHAKSGLKTSDGGALKGFAIAGADKKFVWADAKIDGSKVIVSSDQVADPVAVRYAWANNPECNLVNGAGLPASPFRTDTWTGITEGKH